MISDSVMISVLFTIIISGASIVVPLGMLWWIAGKTEEGIPGSFGLGLLGFFWSQYLLPIPLLMILTAVSDFEKLATLKEYHVVYLAITSILLVSLASLGRLWCIWLMNRRTPSLYRALSSAVGFAAFTAFSRIATYVSYYNYMKLYNKEGMEGLKSLIMANGTVNEQNATKMIESLTSASSMGIAMEGINVILMLVVEGALIVIIYRGIICKNKVKATLISGGIGIVYSFVGKLISSLGTEQMGNVLSADATVMIYNVYQLVCALAGAWIIVNAVKTYKKAMREGAFMQAAYFEK